MINRVMMNFYLKHWFFKIGSPGWNFLIESRTVGICKFLDNLWNCFAKGLCWSVMVSGDVCLRFLLETSSMYFTAWLRIELGRACTSSFRWEVANPNTYWGHQLLQVNEEGLGWMRAAAPHLELIVGRKKILLTQCCPILQLSNSSNKSKLLCTISHLKLLVVNKTFF